MSIQSEINNDPTLSDWMERKVDYKNFDHQVSLKMCAILIALSRTLNKIKS